MQRQTDRWTDTGMKGCIDRQKDKRAISVHPTFNLTICLSAHPTLHHPVHASPCLFLQHCLSVFLPVHHSISLFLSHAPSIVVCLSVRPSDALSHLSFHPSSIHPSVQCSVCLSLCVAIHLSMFLFHPLLNTLFTWYNENVLHGCLCEFPQC